MKFNQIKREYQEDWVNWGYQKYRYHCDDSDNVVSITCLLCNTKSIDEEDIKYQYCKKCNIHHLTPC